MKISKITIDHKSIKKYNLMDDNNIHKLVYKLAGDDNRVLFSSSNNNGSLILLIKHKVEINKLDNINIITKNYNIPSNNQYVAFELIANPTQTVTDSNGRQYKTIAKDIEQWFLNKDIGLDINTLEIIKCNAIKIKNKIKIPVFKYTGKAIVKDSTLLKNAMENGIGRSKSFGCGLLKVW